MNKSFLSTSHDSHHHHSPRRRRRRQRSWSHPSLLLVVVVVVGSSIHPVVVFSREWTTVDLLHAASSFPHIRAQDVYEMDPFLFDASVPSSQPPRSPQNNIFRNHNDNNKEPPTRIPFDPDPDGTNGGNGDNNGNNNGNGDNGGNGNNGDNGGNGNNGGNNGNNGDNDPSASVVTSTKGLSDGERFPQNPVPLNPPRGYFNYDLSPDALHGPGYPVILRDDEHGLRVHYQNNAWKFVPPTSDSYWREFSSSGFGTWNGALAKRQLHINQCGNVGRQSPIDIRLSGVACVEHHQIRTLGGDFRLSGSAIDKRIEPNKLRLVWQRRPCSDLSKSQCAEPDPPHADFPNGWGGFSDALHVDFKVPSEHRIYGQVFDAEMQIFHLHPGRARMPAISVLIQAVPGGHNAYLQTVLDAFQFEYDFHRGQCANWIRNHRRRVTEFHRTLYASQDHTDVVQEEQEVEITADPQSEPYLHHPQQHPHQPPHWAEYSTVLDDPEFLQRREDHDRKLSGIFNPYHPDLIPTYWFFGYDGSLTEPPCSEIVSWFVMDQAMVISPEQLDQMKLILFTHVNSQCLATSTHFHGSVARPIQESSGRQIWRCTRDDFPPDHERGN